MDVLSLSFVILIDSSTRRVLIHVVNPGRAWSSSPACTWQWQCLTVPSLLQLCYEPIRVFFAVHETRRIFLSHFISKASNLTWQKLSPPPPPPTAVYSQQAIQRHSTIQYNNSHRIISFTSALRPRRMKAEWTRSHKVQNLFYLQNKQRKKDKYKTSKTAVNVQRRLQEM